MTQTDLPEPVVPAISRCGMAARSCRHRLPGDVFPQGKAQRGAHFLEGFALNHVAQRYPADFVVRDLDPDICPARDGGLDADALGCQGQGQVIGQGDDFADPHPGAAGPVFHEIGFEPELGDGRAAVDLDDVTRGAKRSQGLLDHPRAPLVRFRVDRLRRALLEDGFDLGDDPGRG